MKGLTLQIHEELYKDIHRCKLRNNIPSMTIMAEHAIRFLESCQQTSRISTEKYNELKSELQTKLYNGTRKGITVYMKDEFYVKLRKVHSLYLSAYLKDTLIIAFYVYLMDKLPRPVQADVLVDIQ